MFVSKLVCMDHIKQQIYRFRYKIYIEEMQRTVKEANHHEHMIMDRMDLTGDLFATFRSNELAATMLCNTATDPNLGYYHELYRLNELTPEQQGRSYLMTRYMFAEDMRKTIGPYQLVKYAFRYYFDRGFRYTYIDCNKHLEHIFYSLGFTLVGYINHPNFGQVALMRLDVTDVAAFRQSRSPLVKALPKENTDVIYA